jgi:hypothetical protein
MLFGVFVFGVAFQANGDEVIRKCGSSLESYGKAKFDAASQMYQEIRQNHKLDRYFVSEERVYVRKYLENVEWKVCEKATQIEKPEFEMTAGVVSNKTACEYRSSILGNPAADLERVGRTLVGKANPKDIHKPFAVEVRDYFATKEFEGNDSYHHFVCANIVDKPEKTSEFCGHAFLSHREAFDEAFNLYWRLQGRFDRDPEYQELNVVSIGARAEKDFPTAPIWKVCLNKIEN